MQTWLDFMRYAKAFSLMSLSFGVLIMIRKKLAKATVMGLTIIMILELTACGTIFYPERKGAKSGSIDPIVAVADAIGLLFFFIPGVIAFAVDFNNGTIYLPHGRHASLTPTELKSISVNGKLDKKVLSQIISQKLEQPIDLSATDVQIKAFSTKESLLAYLNAAGLTSTGISLASL